MTGFDVPSHTTGHFIRLFRASATNEFVARVPAVYLGSAEVSILAFLPDCRINNLRWLNGSFGFEPRPAHQIIEIK